jgi:hypothetical protein
MESRRLPNGSLQFIRADASGSAVCSRKLTTGFNLCRFCQSGVRVPPENIDVRRGRFGKNAVVSIPAATVSKLANAATRRGSTDFIQTLRRKIAKTSG